MVAEYSVRRALLTWTDIANAATELDADAQDLLLELARDKARTSTAGVTTADGPWYVKGLHVRGHIGVGATPVDLPLTPAKGLTIVTARNGTGKTSIADGARHVLSGGTKRSYQVLAENVHFPQRDIVVTVSNGRRDIEITCGADEAVRWRYPEGENTPPPAEWAEAFGRYMPVLLYPEMSQVIENPSNLHAFLKDALELTALEELQGILKVDKQKGSAARRAVEAAHANALVGITKAGHEDLAELVRSVGALPDASIQARIMAVAADLPAAAPPVLALPDVWVVDDRMKERAVAALGRLHDARRSDAAGANTVLGMLQKALGSGDAYLADLRKRDVCPVCDASGHDWVRRATEEARRLATATADIRAATAHARTALRNLASCFPTALPQSVREVLTLEANDATSLRIQQWDRLVRITDDLSVETATVAMLSEALDESVGLAAWYSTQRERLLALRDDAVAAQATVRTHVESWIDVFTRERPAVARLAVAERLDRKVDQWIRNTREEIFAPIGQEVVELWSILNPDADLKLTGIALSGGTKQQRKVALDLADGEVALPAGNNSAAVLSTGQRNALSLATYLPRATQPQSPFGFLILDDPIHAFDSDRVRYLAQHLIELAERFQVIVFTHDDRLWRELRALGALPAHMSLTRLGDRQPEVRVTNVASPGIQRLNELQQILSSEAASPIGTPDAVTSMTLAICRQAVDTEVVAQIEILGRRVGSPESTVAGELRRAKKTLEQLKLLNDYARRAGLPTINASQFTPTIHALNGAAHGRAPGGDPKNWVRQTRKIIKAVQEIGQ